jgi:hypothetical protein
MRRISLDTTEVRACAKCGTSQPPLYRHHKGFDSMLGVYNRSIGFQYYQYRDCVILCYGHHLEIHYIYQKTVDQWVDRSPRGAVRIRKVFIGICDQWLQGKIKTPRIPKTFALKFKTSLDEWEKSTDGRAERSRELDQRVYGVHQGKRES